MENEAVIIKEEPNRWSFRNYLKAIKRFKWWVIGFTALGTVLGFVGFKFILNPKREKLSASYSYNLAGTLDEEYTYRLIDGTLFDGFDVISKENLEAVRSSKEEFKGIDVDYLFTTGSISIERVVEEPKNNQAQYKREVSYNISAKASCFPTKEIGKKFIFELINSPLAISSKAIANFTTPLYIQEDFDQKSYLLQIEDLANQYSNIKSSYYQLQNEFGHATLIDSKPLYEYSLQFSSEFKDGSTTKVDTLKGDLLSKFFIKYETGKETQKIEEIDSKCSSLVKILNDKSIDLKRNKDSLDLLNSSTAINESNNDYVKKVVEFTNNINSLQQDIDSIKRELAYYGWEDKGSGYVASDIGVRKALTDLDPTWVSENTAFAASVESAKTKLLSHRVTINKIYQDIYSLYSNKVTILNSGYVVLEKSLSSLLGIAAGLLVGFVVSSVVCTGVVIYKKED